MTRLVVACLLAAFSLSLAPATAAATPVELLVKLVPGAGAAEITRALGADVVARPLGDNGLYRVRLRGPASAPALIERLEALPAVAYAEVNHERSLQRTANDPLFARQWTLRNIQAVEGWDITTGGEITVALLDTGVSPSHPDLQGRLVPGYDVYNDDDDPRDDEGHGTHIAGIVAANGDNGEGVAGLCWSCKIMPIKVLGARGRGTDADIAQGIRFAVDNGARVIGMSLGGPDDSRTLREAVAYAAERNVLVVAASGNDFTRGSLSNYPAAYPSVLAVSATGDNDLVTDFSTTGDFIDIAAPGTRVWSTFWNSAFGDTYVAASGTSAAAPHVVGAAALVLSVRPELSAGQVSEILQATADDVDAPGRDPQTGYGRLNVARAVQLAADPAALSRSRIQGVVAGAPFDQVLITLSSGQQTRPDASGNYSFDNLPAGSYTITASLPDGQAVTQQTWLSGTPLGVATVRLSFAPSSSEPFQPAPPPSDPAALYFPETQHTLRGAFRTFWQNNGGLPVFGFPTSEEFAEQGEDGRLYTVQYFERHRFEFHPENRPPYNVLLGRLGDTILRQNGRDWFAFSKGAPAADCLFFEATGHSLCGAFLAYWRANGLEIDGRPGKSEAESLALFGQPISEPQVETFPDGRSYLVQWFERARFEDHGPQGVLLGLLGNELAAARGLSPR